MLGRKCVCFTQRSVCVISCPSLKRFLCFKGASSQNIRRGSTWVKLTVWTRPRPPFAVTCATKTASLRLPQVLEDTTGVRRVVVTPQSPECYPPSYSPALSPTHHLPPYLAHPHFIPNSHTFYPPVGPGELPPHQYYQHHLPPMYGDPGTACAACFPARYDRRRFFSARFLLPCTEIISVYGMSNYGREDTYSKPQPKKTKEPRQPDRQNRLNSPPSTPYKGGMGTAYNGYR